MIFIILLLLIIPIYSYNPYLFNVNTIFKNKKSITVSKYIIRRLALENIDTYFGYNGGAILPFFDEMYTENTNIIINRHEQSSGHCAEGYAKISGKMGVVVTTSGPGLTNVITPLQDAKSDGIPLLCISGQVSSNSLGTDAFQECNAVKITEPCVKKSIRISDTSNFIEKFEELLYIANSPRKGPVHIDICKDIFTKEINFNNNDLGKHNTLLNNIDYNYFQIIELKNKILASKKPVLIVGAGAKNSFINIRKFIELYHLPTTTTLLGLGIVDENHQLSLNMHGMHGSYQANKAITESDLIIGLGNRFDDRTIGNIKKYGINAINNFGIIHIDNSIQQINKVKKNLNPSMSILMETEILVNKLIQICPVIVENRLKWINQINYWKNSYNINNKIKASFTSNQIIIELSNLLKYKDNYVISTGVGSHQMVVAQYFNHRHPNKFLTSGSLGTMGTGLPFAIGSYFANTSNIPILIDGDGSFTMSLNDMATIIEYNIPIKIFVINDKKLSMVEMWQDLFYQKRKIGSKFNFDIKYEYIADSYGIKSFVCNDQNNVKNLLEYSLRYDGPILINFLIDSSVCLPFVPNNTPLNEMIL